MIKELKQHLKLKAVLESKDGGHTWFVARQDYLTHADNPNNEFKHSGINIEGQGFEWAEL